MPGDTPDFIPYQAGTPDFIPYQAAPSPAATPGATITATPAPFKAEAADAYGEHANNPFSRYMQEAENLTEEGKRDHPIENVVGTASRGLKDIGGKIATMAPLLMGPGGGVMGAGMGRPEVPEPPAAPAQLPAGPKPSIITPAPADASFVRGIPAEPASRGPAGPGRMLPAAPKPPIEVGPAPDASYVRGIPAEPGGPGMASGPAVETSKEAYPAAGPKPTTGRMVSDLVNQAYGIQPLKPDVPIREQLPAPEPEAAPLAGPQPDSLQARYPDKAVRQMVHANGEGIVNAVGNDPDTMRAIHDLSRVELRQALVNAGEDMGQQNISSSKFAGEGAISRQQAFEKLLAKGLKPKDIIELAKKPSP